MNSNILKNIEFLRKRFHNPSDFFSRILTIQEHKIAYVLLESVSSDDKISNYFMREMPHLEKTSHFFSSLQNTIPNSKVKMIDSLEKLDIYLPNGFTVIFVEGEQKAIVIETKALLDRGVNDSNNEVVLRGPKDSFTENAMTNLGLIRKRIKDTNLCFHDLILGERTKTKITISYLYDLISKEKIDQIQEKLSQIRIDSVLDTSTLKEFLSLQKTAFPTILSTERPDLICMAILEGKIVILVENSPMAIIIPGLFVDYFHNAEDNYLSPWNSSFTRILRILSFFITLLTPAIYVSFITFNKNLIPKEVFDALTIQRKDLFLSAFLEIFCLVTVFEILRESDIRIPNKMGTSIGVVGALVLGDAAVNAGLVSSIAVIITAITAISGLLFTDIDFIYALRFWRYLFLIGASFGGLIGIGIVFLLFVIHLMSLKSLGISYLSPLYPFSKKEIKRFFIRTSKAKDDNRPSYLQPLDSIRKG